MGGGCKGIVDKEYKVDAGSNCSSKVFKAGVPSPEHLMLLVYLTLQRSIEHDVCVRLSEVNEVSHLNSFL